MYKRLKTQCTKKYYVQILNETIGLVSPLVNNDESGFYLNIYSQLIDIKKNVVVEHKFTNWEDINDRYSLGAIATRNFDEDDELRNRLCDVFGGAIKYDSMPEE